MSHLNVYIMNKVRKLLLVCGCFLGSMSLSAEVTSGSDFEILMQKIRQDFSKNPSIDEALSFYREGAFTDVDYGSIQRTDWPPLVHLQRVSDFVFAYTNPENPYYADDRLFDKIQAGLEFWHERNPWCHNWWYNQIAEPQCLGILLIQMRSGAKKLPEELERKLLERMKTDGGDPAKWTGANRTDIALHWIYRSCLSEDSTDLKKAIENAYSPLVYTTQEGFQHDNSYFQHGSQLYIGGYGDEILKGITQIAMYTKGTDYELPEGKVALLGKFMRETYYPTIRGRFMLFDVLGRGVSRPGVTDKSSTALFARRMMELDPAHADEYREIVGRLEGRLSANVGVTPFHTHYPVGDYTLHVRPSYTFDVRMVSTRTMRCEYGNGENLRTYFLSDGCTNIVREGDEYQEIFPVWDWRRIPGVTAPQLKEIPMAKSDWQTKGTSEFAGGVSDSLYGATAYAYEDNYAGVLTRAHKAWFFYENEVVCLGAGITSGAEAEVVTTVNQCLEKGQPVWIRNGKKVCQMNPEDSVGGSLKWVLHNGVGYIFPEGGTVFCQDKMQTGNWYDINHTASREQVGKQVVTVGIRHGRKPAAGTYAYLVVPDLQTAGEMEAYCKDASIRILKNTPDLQVVRNRKLKMWHLVFYAPGTFESRDLSVRADRPCILQLRETKEGRLVVHAADPAQSQQLLTLDIWKGRTSSRPFTWQCDFSQDGMLPGASRMIQLSSDCFRL